jgi:predicted aldo/keto reductase-like oxidoreductase
MPVLTCGGMRYQYQWQDTPIDSIPADKQANLEATVRRALDLGINHIETARGYGSSERQLGQVLPKLPRERIIVQTKVMPLADPRQFLADFRDSLERLGLSHVDLLGIHGINNHELLWWTIRPGGCLEAARELVAEGKTRHVGFSTHGPLDVIQAAIAHERDGGFDYVNLHWFYIFQQNWPAIEAAARADMGVFIISPSDKGGMLYKPSARLVELCQPLHPLVFNVLFCLAHPQVHTLSIGAARPTDFDLPVNALPLLDRKDGLLPPIQERLRQALVDAVGEELADRYAEGLPAWQDCPGYMNMPVMLWLRNLVLAYDMLEYGKMRYNLLGNGGHWFPGLNAAHVDKLDLEKALAGSPFKDKIPGWLRETHALLYEAPKQRLSQS